MRQNDVTVAAKLMAAFCLLGLASASAAPQTYELVGVTFGDGGTANGYFTFDPDAGGACSTHASPCGAYTNINITTTTGTLRTGAAYQYVCGPPLCTGVSPDSTGALFLTAPLGTVQTGLPGLELFFTGVGATPPSGLGSGTSFDVSNSSLSVGAVEEGTCLNAPCGAFAPPERSSVAGLVVLILPLQVSYAANLNIGESNIDITNTGFNGAPLLGPGFGDPAGDICVNVYAIDPGEELVSCCSCLITPDATANLGVVRDLTSNTQTGAALTSVTVKLLATLPTLSRGAATCSNSAAGMGGGSIANGMTAWGSTLHSTPTGTYATTERPFTTATLSADELASLQGRCAAIIGNASGFGVCSSCRAGALGASKLTQ